ncbi:MAG: hypothetical protein ISS56_18680 [Anaerolineae bacterium]|nr:hypothetical protein [Anaerolineae bacterium]
MLTYQTYAKSYLLSCDHCHRVDAIRTARTPQHAQRVAVAFFRWKVETAHGDLCPACTSLWRNGVLDRRHESPMRSL